MLWNISSRTDYLKIFFKRIHKSLFYNTYCIKRIVKCNDETSYEVNGNEYLKLIWEIQWNLRISIFKPYWSNVHLLEPKGFHEKLFFQDQFWLHSCIDIHASSLAVCPLFLLQSQNKVYGNIFFLGQLTTFGIRINLIRGNNFFCNSTHYSASCAMKQWMI